MTYTEQADPGLELTVCEVFTNVLGHLDKSGTGIIACNCTIKDGEVPEADVHTVVDYDFVVPIAKWVYTPEVMAEVEVYNRKGIAEGKLKVLCRNREKVPASFFAMHNELAVRTL